METSFHPGSLSYHNINLNCFPCQLFKLCCIMQGGQGGCIVEIDKCLCHFWMAGNLLIDLFNKRNIILGIEKLWHTMKSIIGQWHVDNGIIVNDLREAHTTEAHPMLA